MSERGSFSLIASLSWRFLRGRGSRLLNNTARAAIGATALGVTAMVIAMALMSGYRLDLQRKLVRGNAAVVIYPLLDAALPGDAQAELEAIPGVSRVQRVLYGQGTLAGGAAADGLEVTLRGVEPESGRLAFGTFDERLADAAPGGNGADLPRILLGSELAERLAVDAGEPLRLTVLGLERGRPRFGYRSVGVQGTFTSGFSEFDRSWAVVDLGMLEELVGEERSTALVEMVLDDPLEAPRVAAAAERLLGDSYLVSDWKSLNRELFGALKLQQTALFFILGLIVLVSTFNVASTVVVLVRERRREIGVLAALGLPPERLRWVFLLYGAALAAVGTALGVGLGATISWVLTRYELVRFDAEVAAIYFISSVPFRVRSVDLAAIVVFSLAITAVACWLPTRRAAAIDPSVALRHE